MKVNPNDACIVVDMQRDFCKGGALEVAGSEEIVDPINYFSARFNNVIFTQDYHPKRHVSFASFHEGKKVGDVITHNGIKQILWPDHCVALTDGVKFHPGIQTGHGRLCIRKGIHPEVDSYSAFYENDKITRTGLGGYLRELGIIRVFFVGLAGDYCVKYSAIDCASLGFESYVVEDLTRCVSPDLVELKKEYNDNHVFIISSSEF